MEKRGEWEGCIGEEEGWDGLQDEARALSRKTDEELQRLEGERQKDIEGRPFGVTAIQV